MTAENDNLTRKLRVKKDKYEIKCTSKFEPIKSMTRLVDLTHLYYYILIIFTYSCFCFKIEKRKQKREL